MEPKHVSRRSPALLLLLLISSRCVVNYSESSSDSDLTKDRDECSDQLVGLAGCLTYVGGDAKAPTIDCCTGLKQVLDKSKKCLCILVKDRNDPSLGLKINATLALSLPDQCHAPANVSECPALLKLPPNSPDAKVFKDFTNAKGSSTTGTPSADKEGGSSRKGSTPADLKNDGGKVKKMMGVEMFCEIIMMVAFQVLVTTSLTC